MNRFSTVILVWLFCAATTWLVLSGPGSTKPTTTPMDRSHGELPLRSLRMEISTTLDLSEDPFTLDSSLPSGLLVHENGRGIYSIRDLAAKKTPIRLTIRPGPHETEYSVRASGDTALHGPAALRVRILDRTTVIKDKTAWSSDGPLHIFMVLPASKERQP
ncbi:hypothetical protein OOT00_13080 [Desulfobotulus sp. H1]|uniref:Uncharacterized protein n=1 Tax=Desulfobotulus pelophilus TaxID=2823377 RepID=A0ABT3NBS3_9BACT|nr:hypothetical protein [Desulfobotulus pelophilus]MCW7754919.1 hypothetical protein [Desulfobotulus pelophilus]